MFHDSGVSLRVFPSRTNLKLHNISVTEMVKKVVDFSSPDSDGPDSSGGSKEL